MAYFGAIIGVGVAFLVFIAIIAVVVLVVALTKCKKNVNLDGGYIPPSHKSGYGNNGENYGNAPYGNYGNAQQGGYIPPNTQRPQSQTVFQQAQPLNPQGQTRSSGICKGCGAPNPPESKYCTSCGTKLD